MTDTLIVTSSLNPVLGIPGGKIINPLERLFQLCCSLLSWGEETNIKNIIICDNTNPKFDFYPINNLLKNKGIKIELLIFQGDEGLVYGKGDGEYCFL